MRPSRARYTVPLYPDPVTHYRGPSPRFLCRARYPTLAGRYRDHWCVLATDTTIAVLPPQVEQVLPRPGPYDDPQASCQGPPP
jgi:hypothetical protein